jgi:energy-coupling factor transport system permease protein
MKTFMTSSLDPRSKLLAAVSTTVILMFFHSWPPLTASFAVLMILVLLLSLFRLWLSFLKGLGFAVVSFFVIAFLAFDLVTALVAALRLLTIGMVFFLFFQITPPESLSNALIKMGVPYSFAFVLSASMQFVPVLAKRAASIRDAQRARGIPLEGALETVRHFPALAGPLLIQAFKLADELAEAMEARGFGAPDRRFRNEPRFRWADWLVAIASLTALGAVVWGRL